MKAERENTALLRTTGRMLIAVKLKKTVCAALAGTMIFGICASAKDNIYAYNKFVSTILAAQTGVCDIGASFSGFENEYDNVNDYYSGLISAFYEDIDADFDNELVTVETKGVTVYQVGDIGVEYAGSIDTDLIANFGDSYTNVFTVPGYGKKYIGIEKYGKTANEYNMFIYELDADTDDFAKILEIKREDNEDGLAEKVWAGNRSYFSHTVGGGISTQEPSQFENCTDAAYAALGDIASSMKIDKDILASRINGTANSEDMRLYAEGISIKTYIRATGLRFTDNPVVYFEDNSQLNELMIAPEIVTVVLDGKQLSFSVQDPMVIEENGSYRTVVPMRRIFEALGADVQWFDEDGVKWIVATTADTTIEMTIDSDVYFVNGEERELDVPAKLINDTTMVPLRAISESLGCSVDWGQDTRTVSIQSPEL